MRTHILLLALMAFACFAYPQAMPQTPGKSSPSQEPTATSETYSDTLRTIKKWVDSEENDDLIRLLAIGDIRTADLVAACDSFDEEIAGAAFGALQLLGKPECEPCAESASQMHDGLAVACSAHISEADFQRIEQWLAETHRNRK